MVAFVHEPYAWATFIHISYISAVTGPIVIKFFWPNFLVKKIGGPYFFRPNFFWTWHFFLDKQFLLDPTKFWTQIFLGPKVFQTQTFLFTQHFFFRLKIYLDQKRNFIGPNICLGLGDFHLIWRIIPFQAEHFRLKSCVWRLSVTLTYKTLDT